MSFTTSLEAKCRMCGNVIVAKADADCPDQWVEKLKPMLTCNRCYDRHDRRRKAEDKLYNASKLLNFEKMTPDKREAVIQAIRKALVDYAKWLAEHYEQGEYHFSSEVFDLIIEKPEQLFVILKMYRKTVRGIYFPGAARTSSHDLL